MIIVIEGPEKAGKTTLTKFLIAKKPMEIRHWGPVDPDDRVYTEQLIKDVESDNWIIWDRCWPSEHVYAKLLNRDRRLKDDPWLGEWLHGRAISAAGVKVIILPDEIKEAEIRRDNTDLPVDVFLESNLYYEYGRAFDWNMYFNDYHPATMANIADRIYKKMIVVNYWKSLKPPLIAGNPVSKSVFIDGEIDFVKETPGAWLPFTSDQGIKFARLLGDNAMKYAWTNINSVDFEYLQDKKVIAFGKETRKWCRYIKCSNLLCVSSLKKLDKLRVSRPAEFAGVVHAIKSLVKEN